MSDQPKTREQLLEELSALEGLVKELMASHARLKTRDITERMLAEDALRESEQRYRELFENANDLIFTLDLEGNLTSMNRAAELATGYSREEGLHMNISRMLPPKNGAVFRRMLQQDMAGGADPATYELDLIAKDGQQVPLEISPALIRRDGKTVGVQVFARNVTERKKLEEQLRASQKMEAVGRLAGGVAHDFNNLLTAILGYSDLVLGELEPGSAMRDDLEAVKRAADRAAMLTRQLLAFSRRQFLSPQVLDLNLAVSNLEKMLRRVIGEDIELVIRARPGLAPVTADPSQIEQVLANLAVNSRDAMPEGGKIVIETDNAEISGAEALRLALSPGAYVMLAVSDTGSGIDEETRAHIFEPFFTTKEQGRGTGLGLSTVYGIVKQSGGSVSVESEPGRGTIFRIYLPKAEALPDTAAPAVARGSSQGSETVLVVEDEDVVRKLVLHVLSGRGYKVLEACHGEEALQILESSGGRIHLVLTDLIMPRMGGLQLAERLAALYPQTRVLYMSGYNEAAIFRQSTFDPNIAFLQKPFTSEALTSVVRRVLDS